MRETVKRALILVPPVLIPLEVIRLARQPAEGPFGNGLAIWAVITVGAVAALVYLAVGGWRLWRKDRPRSIPWFAAAVIALSPAGYYLLWNLFFRPTEF